MHVMDWDTLRHVLALARSGALEGAADRLGVARTTVSRRLTALEQELGTRLFYRAADGWLPTPAGEELIEVAEQVEHDLLATEARLRGQDQQLAGPLHVSTVPLVLFVFREAFASYAEKYPDIELQVSLTAEPRPPGLREADVVTRLSNTPPEHLVGRRVGPIQFGVYAAETLVQELGADAPLHAYPWIGRTGGANVEWFERWLSHNAPGARVVFRTAYEPMLLARLVRSGVGVQILPCVIGEADPMMRRIAPLDPAFHLDLWLLTAPALRKNGRVHTLIQHLAEAMTRDSSALAGKTSG